MGPCLFRHGYMDTRQQVAPHLKELQWGHAFSGMDMSFPGSMPTPERCFNGAMPFQAWILGQLTNLEYLHLGFNGAMPFQAWISVQ